ncbi:MAG: methylenetetrahydrofolate reductase [NAD(P)H] [Clostridiales bacterium]|nr:MAG: methylenetetrahydrofolate reductase [NAD(P)H] [Clostridiales bacterium]
MKVIDIIKGEKPSLSFEVFPPKTSDKLESVEKAVNEIATLNPSYMSVTYGAGGGTSDYTVRIARELLDKGVTSLAHLTCITSDKSNIKNMLTTLKENGIENILALRGDIPEGFSRENLSYNYASELVKDIRESGDFCIGGACYPENHPESENSYADIEGLKKKIDAGCEFLTTQMFFDNNILYNFLYRIQRAGIFAPVVAGIMPVTNARQIKRIISISANALPQRFIRIVDRYGDNPEAMKQAGIAYATEQVVDLFANGINAVHIYSMNNPDVARGIKNNISELIK